MLTWIDACLWNPDFLRFFRTIPVFRFLHFELEFRQPRLPERSGNRKSFRIYESAAANISETSDFLSPEFSTFCRPTLTRPELVSAPCRFPGFEGRNRFLRFETFPSSPLRSACCCCSSCWRRMRIVGDVSIWTFPQMTFRRFRSTSECRWCLKQ